MLAIAATALAAGVEGFSTVAAPRSIVRQVSQACPPLTDEDSNMLKRKEVSFHSKVNILNHWCYLAVACVM